jgi:hypothetical protein
MYLLRKSVDMLLSGGQAAHTRLKKALNCGDLRDCWLRLSGIANRHSFDLLKIRLCMISMRVSRSERQSLHLTLQGKLAWSTAPNGICDWDI